MFRKLLVSFLILFVLNGQDQNLPFHPDVETGTLENGLTYYILENEKPSNRAELRLAVKVGAVDEDEDQLGIAHLVEHMCFNGTEKYPKNELVEYLESIGMSFGPDLNAFTSFDETVYMLTIPTDDSLKFVSGIEILSEWAGYVTFADDEIDKERGVVMDEWRRRRGASARILDEQLPIIFGESKYANHLPIGTPEVIENISHERVKEFYTKWYTPENMAFIAVGDFVTEEMLDYIHRYFGRIPDKNDVEPDVYSVPDHDEKRVVISSDPEATRTNLTITWKQDPKQTITISDLQEEIKRTFFFQMLNQRLDEKVKEKNSVLTTVYSGSGQWVDTKQFTSIYLGCDAENIMPALKVVLKSLKSARDFGFVDSELERAKSEYLARLTQQYNNRMDTESSRLVWQIVSYYLYQESFTGIDWSFKTNPGIVQQIDVQQINRLSDSLFPDVNIVVQVSLPDDDNTMIPKDSDILGVFESVSELEVGAYTDDAVDIPLLDTKSIRGKLIREKYHPELNLHEWHFANGATVFAKPTEFKEDEILFRLSAPGGTSMVPEVNYISGNLATAIIKESGLGEFNAIQLEKKLTGKLVKYNSYLSRYNHGAWGNTTPGDLETFMKLLHLNWTKLRYDPDAFYNLIERYKVYMKDRMNSPEANWRDLINRVNYSDHYTVQMWTDETLNFADLDEAFLIYRDLFANPGNFTFFFTGNFEVKELKSYSKKYIGGLPIIGKNKTEFRDLRFRFPIFPKQEELKMGSEPKSQTHITYFKRMKNDFDDMYYLDVACDVLQVRLRKLLREEMGSTYSVRVGYKSMQPATSFTETYISYSNDPNVSEVMVEAVKQEIKKLKKHGPTQDEVDNIIKKNLNQRETDLEKNSYWIRKLERSVKYGKNLRDVLTEDDRIQSVTPKIVQKMIKKHFPNYRNTVITLSPEN